jgi:phage repressor protein C with HTH and peptisase S24 domain
MEPTLMAGDLVIAERCESVSEGDVVVARHPWKADLRLIKRVEYVDGSGVYLMSDNRGFADAVDSRTFGLVDTGSVFARVISRIQR